MPDPKTKQIVRPFVPNAREEIMDFRPIHTEVTTDPKESAPAPASKKAPTKRAPKKAAPKKPETSGTTPTTPPAPESEPASGSGEIVIVGEELPPN